MFLWESAKSSTCFSKSGIHFIINDNVSGECAAKVGELVHCMFSHCPLIVMLGSAYVFPGDGWCVTFSPLLVLIVRPKLLQALANLSMLCCISASDSSIEGAVMSANRKLLMVSDVTLVFASSLLRLKTEPSVQ